MKYPDHFHIEKSKSKYVVFLITSTPQGDSREERQSEEAYTLDGAFRICHIYNTYHNTNYLVYYKPNQ